MKDPYRARSVRSRVTFYRPAGDTDRLLGLPVRRGSQDSYGSLWDGSAAVLYLENQGGALASLGELTARPLFLCDRVFALMGYELVEGALRDGRLREARRVSFASQ